MALVLSAGCPLGSPISMFIVLSLGNSFEKWEGSLVVVSLGALGRLMIVTWEVSFVRSSLA